MALKFRRGTTAQKSGSLAYGEPYVNTTLGTLQIGGDTGDITLSSVGTGSNLQVGGISGSSLDITGNAKIDGNLILGGAITIGDATADTVNVVASISSSIIPSNDTTFDIGSTIKRYKNIYSNHVSASEMEIANANAAELKLTNTTLAYSYHLQNTPTGDFSIHNNISNSSIFKIDSGSIQHAHLYGDLFVSGNIAAGDVITAQRFTGSLSGSVNGIGNVTNYSASVASKFTTLGTYTASVEDRFSTLATLTGSNATRLTALEVETANLETFSSSALTRLTALEVETANLETFSGSQLTQNTSLATITGSLISSASNANGRLSAIEAVSGTFARTNSTNTFNGNQTISGSLIVTQDLTILGSSSIQNISSSTLNIGTNLITVAVNQPSVRFGGLSVIDSGSAGASGSFLYDSVQDEFIFVHKGNGTNVTSSHFILGPETIDDLGNETYLTNNRLPKGTGKEHLNDSNITDSGTIITLGSNSVVSGSLTVTGSIIGSIAATNGVVSGSSQITAASTTGFSTAVKTQLDANTVVSGSSQINVASTTGDIALGTRTSGDYVASLVAGTNITLSNNTGEGATPTIGLTNNTISGVSLGSNLAALTIGTGLSGTSYNGSGAVTIANTGVLSNVAGTGIGVSNSTGNVTITNTGVTSAVAGTGVGVSGATGAVTISIGQSVATSASPTFAGLTINGAITATGDITAYFSSDRRFKSNIQLIPNALDKVSKLNGVTWTWNDDVNEVTKTTPNTGLIAQEVLEVLPEVVMEREDGHLGLDYSKMVGLLVEAIKEQQIQIDELKAKIGL